MGTILVISIIYGRSKVLPEGSKGLVNDLGVTLAGSIGKLFSTAIGGFTLIPWAVIPAAAMRGVASFELAGRNLKSVVIGLLVTTVAAMFLL